MNALISNPADCKVRVVIRFLQAENVRPCEIHQRLAVYGEHVTYYYPHMEIWASQVGDHEAPFLLKYDVVYFGGQVELAFARFIFLPS